jgi:hypothetical protein
MINHYKRAKRALVKISYEKRLVPKSLKTKFGYYSFHAKKNSIDHLQLKALLSKEKELWKQT